MFFALGFCPAVPFLLNRVWVYEVAIGGGFFCLSAAFYFLFRSVGNSRRARWLALSGLMSGMAVACRPNLLLAVAVILAVLGISLVRASVQTARNLGAFLAPLIAIGALMALYNFRRFGNPFEFGVQYLLAGPFQNRVRLSAANMATGLYFLVFCRPDFSAVFPWVKMLIRFPPGGVFPPEYYIEPIAGALFLAPFSVGAFFVPGRTLRFILWTLPASVVALLMFHIATGFSSPRYEVDFLPWAVLGALANLAILADRSSRIWRTIIYGTLAATVAFGAFVNLAIAISGPVDEMLKARPESYMRLARILSPIERFRPLMNPLLDIEFSARFTQHEGGFREPLLTIGRSPWRHFVYAEHLGGKMRIVSKSEGSTLNREMEYPGDKPVGIRIKYTPETHTLTTSIDDGKAGNDGKGDIRHDIGTLLAAPSQVEIGRNSLDTGLTVGEFTGEIIEPKRTLVRSPP